MVGLGGAAGSTGGVAAAFAWLHHAQGVPSMHATALCSSQSTASIAAVHALAAAPLQRRQAPPRAPVQPAPDRRLSGPSPAANAPPLPRPHPLWKVPINPDWVSERVSPSCWSHSHRIPRQRASPLSQRNGRSGARRAPENLSAPRASRSSNAQAQTAMYSNYHRSNSRNEYCAVRGNADACHPPREAVSLGTGCRQFLDCAGRISANHGVPATASARSRKCTGYLRKRRLADLCAVGAYPSWRLLTGRGVDDQARSTSGPGRLDAALAASAVGREAPACSATCPHLDYACKEGAHFP